MGVKLCVNSFPQKGDRKPHRYPHYRTTIASDAVFSHLSNCSRKAWSCLAVMHDRLHFPTHKSKCGL